MSIWIRTLIAAIACALSVGLGWWLQSPDAAVPVAKPPPPPRLAGATIGSRQTGDDAVAKQIMSLDPFGLTRSSPQQSTNAAAPGAEDIIWRYAALVVRGKERYLIMTAAGQAPLKLAKGERLPDGSRVKAIHANHVEIQGPRGRTSKIYLTEP